ncbi:MAG: hypothetical protein R3C11_08170 [Planctomycetaceae bacterium]
MQIAADLALLEEAKSFLNAIDKFKSGSYTSSSSSDYALGLQVLEERLNEVQSNNFYDDKMSSKDFEARQQLNSEIENLQARGRIEIINQSD